MLIAGTSVIRREKTENGEFLWVRARKNATKIGVLDVDRVVCIYRCNACFMDALALPAAQKLPEKTLFMLTEKDGFFSLYYALTDGGYSCWFSGKDGALYLHADNGKADSFEKSEELCAVYTISGEDVYALFSLAAKTLASHFENLRLLSEKRRPDYFNRLGFCTYNAFHDNIGESVLSDLLKNWKDNGLSAGYIIIDDGWMKTKDGKMMSFVPDEKKFSGGLKKFIENVKKVYGIDYVLLWHTFYGYWTGIDRKLGFPVKESIFNRNGDINGKKANYVCGVNTTGEDFYPVNITGDECLYPVESLESFYDAFYSYLKEEGVDGTKIDAIGWLELFGEDNGGRLEIMKKYAKQIDAAVGKYMSGKAICCSCESLDFFYNSGELSLVRTCKDYMPDKLSTYGPHVFFNAHNSLWLGEFFVCDYDMFQSGGKGGKFHAVNRAISGGPIYGSDEIYKENFDVLRSVSSSDGFVPVCDTYAKPTKRSLFVNIYEERKLFMQFNELKGNYLLAVYNCSLNDDGGKIEDFFTISEIPPAAESKTEKFAVYSDERGFLGVFGKDDEIQTSLGFIEAELFVAVPVEEKRAWIGLEGKYIPSGFIFVERTPEGDVVETKEPGKCLVYSEKPIKNSSVGFCLENGLYVFNATEKKFFVSWE